MKTCPVCQARTFEDAEVCYGCLHRFDIDEGDTSRAGETTWNPAGPSVSEGIPAPDVASSVAGSTYGASKSPAQPSSVLQPNVKESACEVAIPLVAEDIKRADGAGRSVQSTLGVPTELVDYAGWTIRFELPHSVSNAPTTYATANLPAEAHTTLPRAGRENTGPLSLVVSICPPLAGAIADGEARV